MLIPGTIPLFVALLSAFTLRETVGSVARIGLGLILAGVAVIVAPAVMEAAGWQLTGYAICLLSAILWAGYTTEARRAGLDALHATAIVTAISAVILLPIYAVLPDHGLRTATWTDLTMQLVYQWPLTGILALLAYTRAIAPLGARPTVAFTALLPLTVLLLAIPVLGEWPSASGCAGAALAALGVLLATVFAKL
ncbi:MAG: EamA family transporter [Dongiaceae bacterium]